MTFLYDFFVVSSCLFKKCIMKRYLLGFLSLVLLSCSPRASPFLAHDYYRVVLELQDNEKLPFIINVTSKNTLNVFNAEEIILVDEISYYQDSVYIQMPVFEGFIAAKITKNGFKGFFIQESLDRFIPVTAERGEKERFTVKNTLHPIEISGIWEVHFSSGSDDDEYAGKGILKQSGNQLSGTFRTITGDYRYLEGVVDGSTFKLSVFDGAHAFMFKGSGNNSMLEGTFYHGSHRKKNFVAKKNPSYELPNQNNLTHLKKGYSTLAFSFPDENGNLISLKDNQFKNKVTIVQIMGSWCPNCLDESRYFSQYIKENKSKDVAFVALAFEIAKTPEKAFQRIQRLKDHIGIHYPILLAQYGGANKTLAQEKLPMLNHILSYPTSIFIDKKGKIRKIHTGFNGPATGEKYIDFKHEFEHFVDLLLAEK